MTTREIYLAAGLVALVTVILDQITKAWALAVLDDGHVIDVVWTLRFRLTFNTGFAFSTGESFGWVIGLAALGMSAGLIIWMRRLPSRRARLAVGLLLGGAVGNLIDRVFRADDGFLSGGVVDFVDLQWWPVFNVADAAICVAAVFLIVVLGRHPDPTTSPPADAAVGEGFPPGTDDSADDR